MAANGDVLLLLVAWQVISECTSFLLKSVNLRSLLTVLELADANSVEVTPTSVEFRTGWSLISHVIFGAGFPGNNKKKHHQIRRSDKSP